MRNLIVLVLPLFTIACAPERDQPSRATVAPAASTQPAGPPTVAETVSAVVELAATEGHRASGRLSVEREGQALRVRGLLSGLGADSEHGFHIHENGDCSAADASSAGGHFNPLGRAHGHPAAGEHHAGDMLNVRADGQGAARVDVLLPGLGLRDGSASDVIGRAIVVHKDADDHASQPAGNAGARIACGVIR